MMSCDVGEEALGLRVGASVPAGGVFLISADFPHLLHGDRLDLLLAAEV